MQIPDPALRLWLVLGCSCWVQLSLQAQVTGLRAWLGGKAPMGSRGVPVEGQLPSRQHLDVSAHGAAPQSKSRQSDGHLGLTPESKGCTHLLQAVGMGILELGTPMYTAPAAPLLPWVSGNHGRSLVQIYRNKNHPSCPLLHPASPPTARGVILSPLEPFAL